MALIRSHLIEQQVERKGSAENALVAFGGVGGRYSMYIKDDKLQYVQNYVARDYLHVESTVPAGHHELRFEFEVTGQPDFANGKGTPGRGQLYIDRKLVGQAEFPHTTPFSLGLTGGISIGAIPVRRSRLSTRRPLNSPAPSTA